jgi:NAD(P)-dependent dehydrogenase (short-subunit alcohol dehydrogenase family)
MAKTVLVTGANSGLGLAAAKQLAKFGWRVLLGCRTVQKAESAAAAIGSNAVPILAPLALQDLTGVAAFASHIEVEFGRVDVLVNNAAVFGTAASAHENTVINAVAPTLLAMLLRPSQRVVSVITDPQGLVAVPPPVPHDLDGDAVATGSMGALVRYMHSKRLLACAMAHLAAETGSSTASPAPVHVLLAPGMVDTGIHSKAAWPWFIRLMNRGGLAVSGTGAEASGEVYLRASGGEFDTAEPGRLTIIDRGTAIAEAQTAKLVGDAARNADLVAAMRERHSGVSWPGPG